jgi:hypothetical protein
MDGIGKSNGGRKREDSHSMRQYRLQLEQEVGDILSPEFIFRYTIMVSPDVPVKIGQVKKFLRQLEEEVDLHVVLLHL